MGIKLEKLVISKEECYPCPECGSVETSPDESRGEITCRNCGFVSSEVLFNLGFGLSDHEDRQTRWHVGPPIFNNIWDRGLTTRIGYKNKDYGGGSVSNQSQIRRLRKWNERINLKDRALSPALAEIDKAINNLRLTSEHQEIAATLYRKLRKKKGGFRGLDTTGIIYASLILACRERKYPLTIEEVSNYAAIKKSVIFSGLKTFNEYFRTNKLNDALPNYKKALSRFASELSLSQDVENEGCFLLEQLYEKTNELSGNSPNSIIGSILYYLCKKYSQSRTQNQIASITGATDATIRNHVKSIARFSRAIQKK